LLVPTISYFIWYDEGIFLYLYLNKLLVLSFINLIKERPFGVVYFSKRGAKV
jgi:hypothetical protein